MRKSRKKKPPITVDHVETISIKIFGAVIDSILSTPSIDSWDDKTRKEDLLWLLSDNNKHPFSFLRICEILEINNPKKVRKILATLSKSNSKKAIEHKKIIRVIVKEMFRDSIQEQE